MRRALSLTAVLAALLLPAIGPAAAGPEKGGVIDVATIGEPPTLDPMASATDIVGMVGQHIFETLFTFDHNWNVAPLLAEALPTVSPDGKIYEIKLRQGITFHDGSAMDSADVVASLKRWLTVASRGQQVAPLITDIAATDALTVRITLKQPYSPLPALLAFNNSAAVILPSEDQDVPLEGLPEGTTAHLVSSRVEGTATGTMDLGSLAAAARSSLAGTQVIDVRQQGAADRRLTQELALSVVVEPA